MSHVFCCDLFLFSFFFFNDTATTEIYTLSLHDALPIWSSPACGCKTPKASWRGFPDRKSTRLNSSHQIISYAVFCLKKKKKRTDVRKPWKAGKTIVHCEKLKEGK